MPRRVILLLVASAALLVLSFPPFDLGALAWVALVPWLMGLEGATPHRAFWHSYLIGVIFFGGTIWWLIHVTFAGTILLVAYLALYFAAWGLLVSRLDLITPSPFSSPPEGGEGRVRGSIMSLFALPTAWVLLEWLRGTLLTGFGWNLLAHTQWNWIGLIQIAEKTSVYGVSFLVVLVNVALYRVVRSSPAPAGAHGWPGEFGVRRKSALVTASICLGASLIYGTIRLNQIDSRLTTHDARRPFKVAVIQGNIPQTEKWDEAFTESIWRRYEELTLKAALEKPALIIWPETAVPGFLEDFSVSERLSAIARSVRIPLLVGAPAGEGDRVFNSAVLIDPEGKIRQQYRKIHLVPFGEYVPLSPIFSWLRNFVLMGDYSPGDESTVFRPSPYPSPLEGERLGEGIPPSSVLICFEDLFPHLSRRFIRGGARWLIVITNDAWFGRSAASLQHLQASVFRAVENRVWVVRTANTGWSGFVDPMGRRLPFPSQVPRFQAGVATADITQAT